MSATIDAVMPEPPRFGRERMAEGVTDYLRELIVSGSLKAGDRLRVEHLAARFDLSVTPIRESLIELYHDGFVTREARRGYMVAKLTREGFTDQVLILAMVTGELAARAAEKADEAAVAELEDLQRQLEAASDRDSAEGLNHRIHRTINLLADSPVLARQAERSSHYIPRFTWQTLANRPASCTYDHRAVIAAIGGREPEAARVAMVEHLKKSGVRLADELAQAGIWD
ncbi:GntR family transcriptional regulator [Pseudonocardia sp. RS010]|uniref:GntR family transcriptional regulator n=1 Tax=Pseudonocardia sp. RS010 TaxID=3385979 RepID=UPI0039A3D534